VERVARFCELGSLPNVRAVRGTPCLRDSGRHEDRSGRASVDRDDTLQRLRRLLARLHLWGDRLVSHRSEAHEPDEGGAGLRERGDAPHEPLSPKPDGLPGTRGTRISLGERQW